MNHPFLYGQAGALSVSFGPPVWSIALISVYLPPLKVLPERSTHMIRSMEEFTSAFQAARCVSTPLVAIRTADPASTTHFITETLRQGRKIPPLLGWDIVRGMYAICRDSGEELARILGERQAATIGPVDSLSLAQQLCEDGLLLYSNAHRFWNDPGVMQGIWDLRDPRSEEHSLNSSHLGISYA